MVWGAKECNLGEFECDSARGSRREDLSS